MEKKATSKQMGLLQALAPGFIRKGYGHAEAARLIDQLLAQRERGRAARRKDAETLEAIETAFEARRRQE